MIVEKIVVAEELRVEALEKSLSQPENRLGHITSLNGEQLLTLVLNTVTGKSEIWETPLSGKGYKSLTAQIPQAHWYERTIWDLFGLKPLGHPRLRHNLLFEAYDESFFPLAETTNSPVTSMSRSYKPMRIAGEGVYEIPVGPIHAGIIEPGHFHFSCLGEIIFNLEIRLGYVHRGVERRIVETPLHKQRFIAEAAASDSAVAYALAHATAIERIFDFEPSLCASALRTIALEIERAAMHINDLGALAADVGYLAVFASMSQLRGMALQIAELLGGSRLLRGYIRPGGVTRAPAEDSARILSLIQTLRRSLKAPIDALLSNQVFIDRTENIGRVSKQMATDFGLVGIAARASGLPYDTRKHFAVSYYPSSFDVAVESKGDVLARTRIRIKELAISLDAVEELLTNLPKGNLGERASFEKFPKNKIGLAIVESHRGELIHLAITGESGALSRYAIKDASVNNWTALAIAVRNNLLADFPICNKSFGLSYSGHDL